MVSLLRSLFAPLLSLVLLILASGLYNTFTSIRLSAEGYSNDMVGFVSAALYAGIFAGSLWIDRWIAKAGHIRSFITFAVLTTFLIIVQSFWLNPYYWGVLRFLGGICTAGFFVVIESWILIAAQPSMRGAMLSIYLAVFYLALSGGQLLIHIADPLSLKPFFIIAFLSVLSIFPLLGKSVKMPKMETFNRLNPAALFKISPLGLTGVVISGILLAAVYGLVPVYASKIGLSTAEIGNLMAFLIFGGLVFQWPMGKLADLRSRRKVLIATSLLTTLCGLGIAISGHLSPLLLFALAFFFGGFSFTIYPLSMAHACEKVESDQIVSATGGFVLSYGVGAIAGPMMAPLAMNCLGTPGLFYFLAAIALLVVIIGFRTPPLPITEEKTKE